LRQALVHRSFLNEQGGSSLDSYERLEFLGDSVLELVISTELYQRMPDAGEGELSKVRSALVRDDSLSRFASQLNLGEFLRLGKGAEATGGRESTSVLAAVFEAIVAAVYLDCGYNEARRLILQVVGAELDKLCQRGGAPENPKSLLQEYFQGMGRPVPRYQLVAVEGPDHNPVFKIHVLVEGEVVGTGQGGKKSDAERAAAQDALNRIN
jgi:ribonuclease III